MYAIVENRGKQYRVTRGEELLVDRLAAPVGELVAFDRVLMIGQEKGRQPRIGRPAVEGARVLAEVIRHEKGPKIRMLNYSECYQTKRGHRQQYTRVRIQEIIPE